MKRPENRPVCPYGTTYAEFLQERPGRKLRTPEAQRKQIDAALDDLQSAGDFWTLEVVRRLLQLLTAFDDVSLMILDFIKVPLSAGIIDLEAMSYTTKRAANIYRLQISKKGGRRA